ncbi:hypothetical protein K435DRAFT_859263 [Dendrothele bispora CBS 962.96]|uniref:Uncharacterized protein n=1 Tax=Dendrothele bispora (strain CBS 962.96) TaxID=1314807 RepID=A0A4S8M118_DENBC|nr:hypothetical protein K435DRAFT_859263 [Dendrothele bispora CBS 962.96]
MSLIGPQETKQTYAGGMGKYPYIRKMAYTRGKGAYVHDHKIIGWRHFTETELVYSSPTRIRPAEFEIKALSRT